MSLRHGEVVWWWLNCVRGRCGAWDVGGVELQWWVLSCVGWWWVIDEAGGRVNVW